MSRHGHRDGRFGAGNPAIPARAVRLQGGAYDRDLHVQEARGAEAPQRRCAEHPDHPDGRRRAGHALDLWRRDQHADTRPGGEAGGVLQSLPFDRHVLAHAGVAAHRTQSHLCRQWPDRGDRQRLRRLQRDHPEVVGDGRGSPQELRLQHRRLGQVAQHARRADHQQRTVRLLADRLRLRILLRIPGRRSFAVRTDLDAQHDRCHPASQEGLPPHRGYRGGRHQVAARTEGLRAGQAVLHVLGTGRVARAAPGHEGVG